MNASEKTNSIQLDIKTKKDLASAYMSLYDSIVNTKRAKGMSNGQSWAKALSDMERLLNIQNRNGKNNPEAMNYLMRLLKTHKQTESKKSMISEDRFDTLERSDTGNSLNSFLTPEMTKMISAFKHLLKVIDNTTRLDEHMLIEYLKPIIPNNDFITWLHYNPDQLKGIKEDDLGGLEHLYKRYYSNNKENTYSK